MALRMNPMCFLGTLTKVVVLPLVTKLPSPLTNTMPDRPGLDWVISFFVEH
jgi:hypothetical protein